VELAFGMLKSLVPGRFHSVTLGISKKLRFSEKWTGCLETKLTGKVMGKKTNKAQAESQCLGCGDVSAPLRGGRCDDCRGGIYWTEDGLLCVRGHQPDGEIFVTPEQQKILAEKIWTKVGKPRPQVEDVEAVAEEPVVAVAEPQNPAKAVTIEATGKQWKAGQLIFAAVMVLGIATCSVGAGMTPSDNGTLSTGMVLLVVGFAGIVGCKIGAWWHHG